MHLKSTPIFLLILVICISTISHVYAYTDAELTHMYRGSDDNKTLDNIDLALHSGSLHCSDLSPNLHFGYCGNQTSTNPQPEQTTSHQNSSNSSLLGILVLLIIPIVLLMVHFIIGNGDIGIPKFFMKPKAKQSKSNVKQYATFIKEDDSDVDMTTLDDNVGVDQIISNHDYHERQKQKTTPRKLQLSTSHNLLLSLGLIKVKKK